MSIFDKSIKECAKVVWEWYDDFMSLLGHAVVIGWLLSWIFR